MGSLHPRDPEELCGYTLVERIGESPRGVVYRGRRGEGGDSVAIKLLPETPDASDIARRLESAKRVSSSHVARVLDAGVWEGQPYFVREYVEGRSLAELVETDGTLTGDALQRVAVAVLTALTSVHAAGLAHAGLTPYNVIVGTDGLRLTDVAIDEPSVEAGYLSPQLDSEPYGARTDVYSWAAVVTFAATGRPPSGQAVLNAEPELGAMTEPLRGIVVSALSVVAGERPTTHAALEGLTGAGAPVPGDGEPLRGVPMPPQALVSRSPDDDEPLRGVPLPPPSSWVPQQLDDSTRWEPPPPSATEPQQAWWEPKTVQATVSGGSGRKFPIGLVAAMATVVLVSGLGLWGASQYVPKQSLQPASASGDQTPVPGTASNEKNSADIPATPKQRTSEQPEKKAPRVKTPEPQATDVLPFDLPRDDPSSVAVPELSTVPSPLPTQPIATQAVAQPTVTVTATPSPERNDRRENAGSPEPHPTQPPTPNPSHSPQPQVTVTVTATPTPTAEPPTPTEQPTVSATPTPTRTFATNPYTPVQVCGDGFVVQRSTEFTSGVTYQLYHDGTGEHCVVTLKNSDVGKSGPVSATLEVRNGPRQSYNGDHEFFAGPVKLRAEGKCVRYAGAVGSFSTNSTWDDCG
ncbi:serine/threonine-protein kinase [Nonomuraea cavernae]|uniref:non-specific serine/threonine protein kinase n=1 Tax=Nonomuraea cavernae TaxID=2045107 RepID=A0A918DUH6_9ACTN|nr:serine/threonine-protein kinase [Nonomuraea cavernae]MCA2190064.1 protein kinase [Nonomuraea cavernae]GGO82978.1 protein kinase [Nonomuraea cavernae]